MMSEGFMHNPTDHIVVEHGDHPGALSHSVLKDASRCEQVNGECK